MRLINLFEGYNLGKMTAVVKNLREMRERLIVKFGSASENLINSKILALSMRVDNMEKKVWFWNEVKGYF